MKNLIPLVLLARPPTLAYADPIATGPFYLRHNAAMVDRKPQMLEDIAAEIDLLRRSHIEGNRSQLVGLLEQHRRRRARMVPALLVEVQRQGQ